MKTVLLLEDEPLMAKLFITLLGMEGLKTTVVTTVAAARTALADQNQAFDLVIADKSVADSNDGFVILDECRDSGNMAIRMAISGSPVNCPAADLAYHKNGDIKALLATIARTKTLHQTRATA
jgi:CheY-like chemotaxis protein